MRARLTIFVEGGARRTRGMPRPRFLAFEEGLAGRMERRILMIPACTIGRTLAALRCWLDHATLAHAATPRGRTLARAAVAAWPSKNGSW